MKQAHVTVGVLGWGNRKGGLEAFGSEGRWGGVGAYAEHGDLLGDALEREGQSEGATLIVVSLPRFHPWGHPEEKTAELAERIEALVREVEADGG